VKELLAAGESASQIAVLYRVHALSRPIEEALLDRGYPYVVFGGLRFYERREIKDLLSFLRLSANPADPVALYRVINLPPRGIGDKTVDAVTDVSARSGLDMWEAAREVASGRGGSGRVVKGLVQFIALVEGWREASPTMGVAAMLERIIEETGYRLFLETEKEARGFDRLENVEELLNAARAFDEEAGGGVSGFLDRAALVSDQDRKAVGSEAVTLMTVHSAKGLEFRNVFIAGMEEGIFPHQMSSGSPAELEEERRLCYVAMTRAGERLYLTRSRMRRVYGAMSEARMQSRFLGELPETLRPVEEPPRFLDKPWQRQYSRMPERPRSTPTWKPPEKLPVSAPDAEGGSWFLPDPEEARYRAGMQVRHGRYGAGRVTGVSGEGPLARVVVRFTDGSERTFVAGPARLEIHLDG
jgi:DNA helicase-2/ATP-dependent DNA helicase PcrA